MPGLAALLLGCAAAPGAATPAGSAAVTVLGERPGTARVATGTDVEVRLPAQLGAGYSWAIAALPKGVLVTESVVPSASALDGHSDIQAFKLRATTAGRYRITFVYRRPFEPDVPAKATVTHIIDATAAR